MNLSSKKPKVCFLGPYCYPLFNPQNQTMFGGSEVRISQIAREMARRSNFKVSLVVADHGQPHIEVCDGVELISWIGKGFYGIPAGPQPADVTAQVSTYPEATGNTLLPSLPLIQPGENSANLGEEDGNSLVGSDPPPVQLREYIKNIYKRLIPWRARIVLYGLRAGIKDGLVHLIPSWKEALKMVVHGMAMAARSLKEDIRISLAIARNAIGSIADKPVYYENVKIYHEADADIYVVPGNSHISAEVAFFCKKWKRAYVMLAGSEMDFSPEIRANRYSTDIYYEPYSVKLYSIENADLHIVQNQQQLQLAGQFGVAPVLIHNPINLERRYPKAEDAKIILWVGNTDERVKRPSLLLEVARWLSECQFMMIVTPAVEEDYQRLLALSSEIPNLDLLSRIPFHEVEKYFAQARLFVNTSTLEGFPNTFLQAGKYAIPVVSLKVDPGEMLSRYGCGLLCYDDVDLLKANIRKLMTDADVYSRTSVQILEYVRQYHDKEKIIPQYEAAFQSVLQKKRLLKV